MGEIKSTLDLVMEKTRHLTLSPEEKDAQTKVEVHKRLKGLVQKYQDNLLRKDGLEKELDILKKTYDMNVICDLQERLPLFNPNFSFYRIPC